MTYSASIALEHPGATIEALAPAVIAAGDELSRALDAPACVASSDR